MTSRDRVRVILAHRTPDKIPLDFGSSTVSGMHVTCVQQLRAHFGLEKRPIKVHKSYQVL